MRSPFSIEHILLLSLLALTGFAAEALAMGNPHAPLWLVAIGGGLLGIVLAKVRTVDSLSHLLAIMTGAAGTLAIVAYRQVPADQSTSFWGRFGQVATDLREWYLGSTPQEHLEALLVTVLLQIIVWLVSYLSAWSLVRQRWLTVSLVLPASILLVALLFGDDVRGNLLELYVVLAIVQLARVTYVRRHQLREESGGSWNPNIAGWRSLLPAFVVALLVVGAGTATPAGFSRTSVRPMAEYAGERYLEAQERTLGWVADRIDLKGSGSPLDSFPRYTSFDDAFSVGGDLNLSDQPEILVRSQGPAPYLSAQSYDTYTGRGWESTVEDTFDAEGSDGVRYSLELIFRPGQELPYSFDERIPMAMEVTSLTPAGDTLFSAGMHLTADERASVRMSWLQLDGEIFELRDLERTPIPPDLTGVVSELLQGSELSIAGEDGLLYPADDAARERLMSIRSKLAERFIDVSWTIATDGRVDTMIVTGQLPVYEDNVLISRAESSGQGQTYVVTSLMSEATPDHLRQASADYPEWVTSRYLVLPTSVTVRTTDLALQVAGSGGTAYDRAKSVEAFLRNHIVYDLDVGVPPADADIVDYVLFENRSGYCEYYASAMTVMLRSLGIPAKTVVGYFPAEFDSQAGGYLYRQKNAHAWTEAYFPDYGWIRFEPTPSQPASAFGDVRLSELPSPEPTPTRVVPTGTPEVRATGTTLPPQVESEPELPQPVSVDSRDDGGMPWLAVAITSAVTTFVIAAVIWFLIRGSNGATGPQSLFASLVRWGRVGGVQPDTASTPREYASRLGRRYPTVRPQAMEVVDAYEEFRYGTAVPTPSRLEHAAMSLRLLRRRLLRSLIRRR